MPVSQKYLSGELSHRFAAIDIGSNSIRLVVAEGLRGGNYRILDEEREATRLSRGLHSTRLLSPEAIDDSLATLRRFKQIAEGYGASELRTIATCAVREAKNGPEFCRRAKDEIGIEIEVISAEKEAHLAFYSVRRGLDLAGKNVVLADIGGGSTEIVLASGHLIEAIYSTTLGAVRLTEIYGGGQAMAGEDYERMLRGIDRQLRKKTKKRGFHAHVLLGTGGTFTSLAAMVMARKGQTGLPLRGYEVTHAELSHLLDQLRKMPPKARRNVPGMTPDRADIIVAGLAIVERLLRRFKVNTVLVHNRGVRDGLLLTMIEQAQGAGSTPPIDRDTAIDRFAAACGAEVPHGRHVAFLAGRIYGQLTEPLALDPGDRPLLETAARLQDVGYLINYDRHHKHSYHLILNSRLQGFQPHELELIANVARYHRGSEPKKKHANFTQLNSADRRRVKRLAAILRLAAGLDRSHSQTVRDVDVGVRRGEVEMLVYAADYPEVDIWGARRRAGMLEKVFGVSLSIQWAGRAEPAAIDENAAATGETASDETPAEKTPLVEEISGDAQTASASENGRKNGARRRDRRASSGV